MYDVAHKSRYFDAMGLKLAFISIFSGKVF